MGENFSRKVLHPVNRQNSDISAHCLPASGVGKLKSSSLFEIFILSHLFLASTGSVLPPADPLDGGQLMNTNSP